MEVAAVIIAITAGCAPSPKPAAKGQFACAARFTDHTLGVLVDQWARRDATDSGVRAEYEFFIADRSAVQLEHMLGRIPAGPDLTIARMPHGWHATAHDTSLTNSSRAMESHLEDVCRNADENDYEITAWRYAIEGVRLDDGMMYHPAPD